MKTLLFPRFLQLTLILSIGLTNTVHSNQQEIPKMLWTAIECFSKREGCMALPSANAPIGHIITPHGDQKINFVGINKTDLPAVDYPSLRSSLLGLLSAREDRIVQIIGDSKKFTPEGTIAGRNFLAPFFQGTHVLEYGFTGYFTDRERLDINSFLNEYVEDNPQEAGRVLANVVGHSILALNKWGCKTSDKIRNFVVVYNDNGMGDGFTKFGDDVEVSDGLLQAEKNDLLLMLEGAAQSFNQATNVLKKGVNVKAIYGIRAPEDRLFFSVSEFFQLVKSHLLKNPELKPANVREILDTYLLTHKAWDITRPDAETKAALFNGAVDAFINGQVYQKLLAHFEAIDVTSP